MDHMLQMQVYPEIISGVKEMSPLLQKCALGEISDVEILLKDGAAKMSSEDAEGLTALLYAIRVGLTFTN